MGVYWCSTYYPFFFGSFFLLVSMMGKHYSRLLIGSCRMAVMAVILLVFMSVSVNSQSSKRNNTLVRRYCSQYGVLDEIFFLRNLNTTLSSLRRQLSNARVHRTVARTIINGVSVYGLFLCRLYISHPDQCLKCFDMAERSVRVCGVVNGGHAIYDDCNLRYENNGDYLDTPVQVCQNNRTRIRSSTGRQDLKGFLLDIRKAAPKTFNFYVASTRKISSENVTVYAIAQCVENTSHAICQDCLTTAFNGLYNCLPNLEAIYIDPRCFARYSNAAFFNSNRTTDITNLLKGHSSKLTKIAGALGGACLFFLIALTLLYSLRRKSKKTKEGEIHVSMTDRTLFGLSQPMNLSTYSALCSMRVHRDSLDISEMKRAVDYNYKHMQLATDNFSEKNIIGKGGFGEVFKATLDDNQIVAVKKLEVRYLGAKVDFQNEILLIRDIKHVNLLRLLGWSSEGSNLLLVLEYMPNGSLDKYLWGAKRGVLNWKQRYDIILGIARGLAHLHDEFHIKIIHRDIKSSNILLDDDFQPKIADFGLARFQPGDQSHVITKFSGTLGYTAPEYARYGILSDKVDTYSFGVVILEIVSGRRCTNRNFDGPSTDHLLEHAWKLYESKRHLKLVDETMDPNQYEDEQVVKIIEIALLCTQSPVSKRPKMSEVVLMLPNGQPSGELKLTRPTLIYHNRRIRIGSSNNSACGIGEVSKSPMELEANEGVHYETVDNHLLFRN